MKCTNSVTVIIKFLELPGLYFIATACHWLKGRSIHTDALRAFNAVKDTQVHLKKAAPAKEATNWLPWVHIVIGKLKHFLNGTSYGVSAEYLQKYLDEFCYRFIRPF